MTSGWSGGRSAAARLHGYFASSMPMRCGYPESRRFKVLALQNGLQRCAISRWAVRLTKLLCKLYRCRAGTMPCQSGQAFSICVGQTIQGGDCHTSQPLEASCRPIPDPDNRRCTQARAPLLKPFGKAIADAAFRHGESTEADTGYTAVRVGSPAGSDRRPGRNGSRLVADVAHGGSKGCRSLHDPCRADAPESQYPDGSVFRPAARHSRAVQFRPWRGAPGIPDACGTPGTAHARQLRLARRALVATVSRAAGGGMGPA